MNQTAASIIEVLNMLPHPEGGFYAETFRHAKSITLPDGRLRSLGTTIYFLLQNKDKSHFHRLRSDETWFFHAGETIELLMLTNGKVEKYKIGAVVTEGEYPQLLIPAHTWFAAHLPTGEGYALVSCTVTPGFDFEDFELATAETLQEEGFDLNEIPGEFLI
jgi:predicted cupin superfamily sugar epimerase